jgi:asparagine synthetase B (glutamine-hydrolysing)
MKSGNIATPVDTPNAEASRLEAEVKRLEEAYARAISQVDKEQITRDKAATEVALEKALQQEVVEATRMPLSAPIKKSAKKTTSTKKKKKTKNK